MEGISNISAWLTPALIVGLFLWLRADIRNTRHDLQADIRELESRVDKRFDGIDRRFDGIDRRLDGIDDRLRAVEVEVAEVRGQLTLMRDYILGRNLRQPDDAAEPAPGD